MDILAPRQAPLLATFAASNVLVAFDYDGTLAPIVSRPSRARMRATTKRLLMALAERYPCVVISGRSREDVVQRIDAVPVWHVAGNHGVEPWGEQAGYALRVRDWVRLLNERLAGLAGVEVEDKRYSVTVHYRRAGNKRHAIEAIESALRDLRGFRTVGGKQALNLVPKGAPHKGAALERARRLLACDTAIYVGDDETDEDAFRSARPDRLLGIRIGQSRGSRARYRLREQRDIDRLLKALIDLRPIRGGAASSGQRAAN
jgi:trehalose 6-phosphate phosphatase